jgi:hypothetical protein
MLIAVHRGFVVGEPATLAELLLLEEALIIHSSVL